MMYVVTETIHALEGSLGDGRIQAVLDIAERSEDPSLRRHVSQAQASLDYASLLRGRLRAALRATPFAPPRTAIFDLVSTTERAVRDACLRHATDILPVSCPEREIPVAGMQTAPILRSFDASQRRSVRDFPPISRCTSAAATCIPTVSTAPSSARWPSTSKASGSTWKSCRPWWPPSSGRRPGPARVLR